MGAYTYLNESEFNLYSKVEDKDLNELFQEVSKAFPNTYYLSTMTFIKKDGFFSKPKQIDRYEMYVRHDNSSEVQIFNFPSEGGFFPRVDGYTVMTYFFGLLNASRRKVTPSTLTENKEG
jgi:hypothetical protein